MKSSILLVALLTVLSGCNTVKGTFEGAGKDLSSITGRHKTSTSDTQSQQSKSKSRTTSHTKSNYHPSSSSSD